MIKSNPCKLCGSTFHTKAFCPLKPRKPIPVRAPLKRATAPIARKTSLRPSAPQRRATGPQTTPRRKSGLKPTSNVRKKLIIELDKTFSVYIRKSNSHGGLVRCVTCPTRLPWEEMQNGHFIPRRYLSTRWDELNCHPQCSFCNETLGGNLERYEHYLETEHGVAAIAALRQQAHAYRKFTEADLRELISYYKRKVAELL